MKYKIKISDNNKISIPLSLKFENFGLNDNLSNYLDTVVSDIEEDRSTNLFKLEKDVLFKFYFKLSTELGEDYKNIFQADLNRAYYNSFYPFINTLEVKSLENFGTINSIFKYRNTYSISAYNNNYIRIRYFQNLNELIPFDSEIIKVSSPLFIKQDSEGENLPLIKNYENSLVFGNRFIKLEFFELKSPTIKLISTRDYFNNIYNLDNFYFKIDFFSAIDKTFRNFKVQNNEDEFIGKISLNNGIIRYELFINGEWFENNEFLLYEI